MLAHPTLIAQLPEGWLISKPAGWLTRPEARSPGVPSVLEWAGEKLADLGSGEIPLLVHRLDLQTSGVLCLARTAAGQAAWSAAFENRQVSKGYFLIAWGAPASPVFRIAEPLDGKSANTQVSVVARGRVDGQPCFAAEVRITTGRMHQIRRHLAGQGFPIWCDTKYGGATPDLQHGIARVALHAQWIQFPGGPRVQAPLPVDLQMARRAVEHGEQSNEQGEK